VNHIPKRKTIHRQYTPILRLSAITDSNLHIFLCVRQVKRAKQHVPDGEHESEIPIDVMFAKAVMNLMVRWTTEEIRQDARPTNPNV
jgi:hypothetical protein